MGVRMVVREEPEAGKAWIFVKPFTKSMWAVTGGVFLYNGLIVWLMEKAAGNEELKGSSSFWSQLGSLVWLSFTTLFPIHGKKHHHLPFLFSSQFNCRLLEFPPKKKTNSIVGVFLSQVKQGSGPILAILGLKPGTGRKL